MSDERYDAWKQGREGIAGVEGDETRCCPILESRVVPQFLEEIESLQVARCSHVLRC